MTLFGESAGAKSIGLHLLMPGRRALPSSRHAVQQLRVPVSKPGDRGVAWGSAQELAGLRDGSLRCMQDAPAEEVIESMDALHGFPRSVGDFFTWGQSSPRYMTGAGHSISSSSSNGRSSRRSRERERRLISVDFCLLLIIVIMVIMVVGAASQMRQSDGGGREKQFETRQGSSDATATSPKCAASVKQRNCLERYCKSAAA